MAELLIIVPSRGRPQNTARLMRAWADTRAVAWADLRIDVDADDPEFAAYQALELDPWVRLAVGHRWRPMVWKLNRAARQEAGNYFALGFMGDDHVPETAGWAERYLEALRALGTGIVYGDDGLRGESLPTQWAMTSDIVTALDGRMVPAPVEHLYSDSSILDLGKALDRITYLPDVRIIHEHYLTGRVSKDGQYARVNSRQQYRRDEPAYRRWRRDQLPRDAAAVREVLRFRTGGIVPAGAPMVAVDCGTRIASPAGTSTGSDSRSAPAAIRGLATGPIIATYARRDEPQSLIDGLRANLAWVDGFVELQVPTTGPWGHEGQRLAQQRRMILDQYGSCWVLFIDPDERLEDRAGDVVLEALADADPRTTFGFPLRELWTPTAYRVDGEWGRKKPRRRLFHLHDGQRFMSRPIHCGVTPTSGVRSRDTLDVWMYHLKSIEPENRRARAEAYLAADPEFRYQRREGRDWSWLYDETGLRLEEIPPERAYTPVYEMGSYLFKVPQ